MKSGELARKLFQITVMGAGVLSLTLLLAAIALHTIGAHRLASARADLERRWGHLEPPTPPPPVPDDENGARWLAAGGQSIVCTTDEMELLGTLSGTPARAWSADEHAMVEGILAEQQHALALLLRVGSHQTFHAGVNGARANHDEINFLGMFRGIRLLLVEARLAWSDGRTEDSLAALDAVGRSADGLLRTPIVTALTGGAAAQRWAARAAADIVEDPGADTQTLAALRDVLPIEDPIQLANRTLAASIEEIADEGLTYIDDLHDPSLGWSIPFWVSNRTLIGDLVVSEILQRWGRYLELGQQPVVEWPADAATDSLGDGTWPPWIALAGTYTPNLLGVWARVQAASSELQQLGLAIDLRHRSPEGVDSEACSKIDSTSPTVLTGEPVSCRWDSDREAIVLEVPGAEPALRAHLPARAQAATFPTIELRSDRE